MQWENYQMMVIFLLETPPNLEEELNYAGNLTTTIASSRARCDFLIFSSFLDDDKSPYDDAQWTYHSHGCSKITILKNTFRYSIVIQPTTICKYVFLKKKSTLAGGKEYK